MEKLLTELNKIYTKLGGQESDIPVTKRNDLEFIVDKIEDKVGSSGGGTQDPYAGLDLVIKFEQESEIFFTILKGDFYTVFNKIRTDLVRGCVFGFDSEENQFIYSYVSNIYPFYIEENPNSLGIQYDGTSEGYFVWYSDGTIALE